MLTLGRVSTWSQVAARMVDQAIASVVSPATLSPAQPTVAVGTVLRAGTPADRFLLSDQFLLKSLLLTLHELPNGVLVAAVLNRPTANLVQFHTPGKPRRCISFGGDGRLMGDVLEVDANGLLWLLREAAEGEDSSVEAEILGIPVGESGVRRVNAMEAAEAIRSGDVPLTSFLLVSGVVAFSKDEMDDMLEAGHLYVVEDARPLWPQLWSLADAQTLEPESTSERGAALSDGTSLWWAASQLGGPKVQAADAPPEDLDALVAGLQPMPAAGLADEALTEWLKFFAGHKEME
jgi:hypothetical protein